MDLLEWVPISGELKVFCFSDIRDLLSSLGGQLDLDDPLLTNIVSGRASGDLMLAICDYGGLAPWLSKHSEFDVNESRVRLVSLKWYALELGGF